MSTRNESLLDPTGWRILRELESNARISQTVLGQRVGMSAPAVAERIRRLEDAGIIQGSRAVLDRGKLGFSITAFVRIRSANEQCSRVAALACELPEIVECHRVTGSDSYIMKAAVESMLRLEKLLDRLIPYGQLTTSLVLSSPVIYRSIDIRGNDLLTAQE